MNESIASKLEKKLTVEKLFNLSKLSAITGAVCFILMYALPTYTVTINGMLQTFDPYFMLLWVIDKIGMAGIVLFICSVALLLTNLLVKKLEKM